jgi:glycine cleavage system aminomethyltransferase T
MAFKHINSSTQTVVSILHQVDSKARPNTPINVHNGHSAAIFVGDTTITTSGATIGRTIAAGANQVLYASAGDIIYAISAAASAAGAIVLTYSA